MKSMSFAVTGDWPHDLSITDNVIDMAEDEALFVQKVQAVWSTNRGEWNLDPSEGIDFHAILRKMPDEDEIRAELEAALETVSETAAIVEFSMDIEKTSRHAVITARIQDGGNEYAVPLEYD